MNSPDVYGQKPQPETAQAYCDALTVSYSATFVPQSQSRNKDDKQPTLNWLINFGYISTDYMQGIGHLPNYSHKFAHNVAYDARIREACETGKSAIIKHKNAYDACQEDRMMPLKKAIPAPKLVDVLYSLVMDSDVIEYGSFAEWADTFGYNSDSIKARDNYDACMRTALQLRQLIDLDAARAAFEDY